MKVKEGHVGPADTRAHRLGAIHGDNGDRLERHVPTDCTRYPCDRCHLLFGAVLLFYFRRLDYTTSLVTAISFVSFVVAMDFFVVTLLIQGRLEMFGNLLGTGSRSC